MPKTLVAQLYTLREYTQTPADIASTLRKVKKIGYDAVQCSALGPVDPAELGRMLREEGLRCVATHEKLSRLRDHRQQVVEEHALWGCSLTAIGGYFPKDATYRDWQQFAAEFSELARQYAGTGVRVGYHNHSHELARFGGPMPVLRMLIESLDPAAWIEIDTYWITHGGGDPSDYIRRCKGKIPAVHLKDMAIKPDKTQYMAEVGEGNLNWAAILAACEDAGVEYLIVEQDTCYRDPFDSLEISLKNLRDMGI